MFEWSLYLIILAAIAGFFFVTAVLALVWAVKHGQFQDFDQGARSIFDSEEPEGVHQDFFPGEAEKQRKKLIASQNS